MTSILKSALKALALWAVIMLCLVGYLVKSNLDTRNYYQQQMLIQNPSAVPPPKQRKAKKIFKASPPPTSKLLKHQDKLDNLVEDLENLKKSHLVKMNTLKSKMGLLHEVQEKIGDSVFIAADKAGDATAPKTSNIEKVLKTRSMSALKDIEYDVGMAIQELEAMIEGIASTEAPSGTTIDFAALDQVLKQEFPERDPSVNKITCGSIKTKKGQKTKKKRKVTPDDAARTSHMKEMVIILDELLGQRSSEPGKYYPMDGKTLQASSLQMIRRWLQAKIRSLSGEINSAAESTSEERASANDGCLDEDTVLGILQGALDGVSQNVDLRNHLRRRAMELDPKAETIILDADLPDLRPFVPEPESIHLSRILDKPILFNIVDWIDKLVEEVGGYNDSLDNYLDSIAGSSRASVGEIVVENVLTKADGVEIPNPKLHIEKLARTLLKK